MPSLFVVVTLAHFGLVAWWFAALRIRFATRDEFAFHAYVAGLGSFQSVLHLLAFTVGLSPERALAAFVVLHAALALVLAPRLRRRHSGSATHVVPIAADAEGDRLSSAMGLAGMTVLAMLVAGWALAAPKSLAVTGADAAHYHVPYAVNIALGANPFGLPATPHAYPMGTSVLAAWFILPFRDPLLVDLAPLPAFALAWFATLLLVGTVAGRSGLSWGPWCALLMFSAPLFRSSLLMSADLFYCAAFLAVTCVLLLVCTRLRANGSEILSLALATGMLLSTKVTGAFSVVVLFAVYGTATVVRLAASGQRFEYPARRWWCLAVAPALALASGGIWLVRNWYDYGSPLAPTGVNLFGWSIFPGETYGDAKYYLSVLQDMRDVPGYDAAARLWYWSRRWLGAWFPLAGLATIAAPVLAAAFRSGKRRTDTAAGARLLFTSTSAIIVVAHVVLLAGVQWSSLEWTEGFSLRYLLPCFAVVLIAGYGAAVAALPSAPRFRRVVALTVPALTVAWYAAHQATLGAPNGESPAAFGAAGVAIGMLMGAAAVALRRPTSGWQQLVGGTIVVALAAGAYGLHCRAADDRLVASAQAEMERQVLDVDRAAANATAFRGVYLKVLAFERSSGIRCARRRLFTTTRWDFPLELQSPRFDNQVFDARGPSYKPWMLSWERPGSRPCDYVVADEPTLETTRGVLLVNALKAQQRLRPAATHERYVVFAAR